MDANIALNSAPCLLPPAHPDDSMMCDFGGGLAPYKVFGEGVGAGYLLARLANYHDYEPIDHPGTGAEDEAHRMAAQISHVAKFAILADPAPVKSETLPIERQLFLANLIRSLAQPCFAGQESELAKVVVAYVRELEGR